MPELLEGQVRVPPPQEDVDEAEVWDRMRRVLAPYTDRPTPEDLIMQELRRVMAPYDSSLATPTSYMDYSLRDAAGQINSFGEGVMAVGEGLFELAKGQVTGFGAIGTFFKVRRALREPGSPTPPDFTIADTWNLGMAHGLIKGIADPIEKIPGIGKIVAKYTDPMEEELNRASLMVNQLVAASNKIDPQVAGAIGAVSNITGHLAGWMVPFTGILRASKFIFGAKLGLSPLVAEMAGGFTYGFATKEPSLIYHLAGLEVDENAKHTHEASFISEMNQRLLHGILFGGELAGLSMVFSAFGRAFKTGATQDEYIRSIATGTRLEELLAVQGGTITADGKIILPVITEKGAAEAIAQQETILNMIMRDPEAGAIFTHGGQTYDAMVAAVKNLRQGEVGVVYQVFDPLELMTETQKRLVQQAEAAQKFLKPEFVTGGRVEPLTVTIDQVRGLIDKEVPLFMVYGKFRARGPYMTGHPFSSSAATAEKATSHGQVVEALIKPSSRAKIWRFKNWDEALYPDPKGPQRSITELLEMAEKKNIEVIAIDRGTEGYMTVIPVTDDVIKAVGDVRPAQLERAMARQMGDARLPEFRDKVGEITQLPTPPVEPLAVSLARRFEDLNVQVFRREGEAGYNIMFWPKDVKVNQAKLFKQFKAEGFFEGQRVLYNNMEWAYIGRSQKGLAKIQDLTDPKQYRFVKPENVSPMFKASTIDAELEEGFGTVFLNEFRRFMDTRIAEVADKAVGLEDLRKTAKTIENVGTARRDINLKTNAVLTPEEVPGGAKAVLDDAAKLADDVRADRWDDVLIQFPEPVPNEVDVIWNEFLASKGLRFSDGQSQALKWSTITKLRQQMYAELDPATKKVWENVSRELDEIISKMPNNAQTQAMLRGWQWIPTRQGIMIRKPGTQHYKMFRDSEAAMKYLRKQNPLAEELLPGGEYMDLPVQGGFHKTPQRADPDALFDIDELTVDQLKTLFADKGLPSPWLKSMYKYFGTIEAETGLPLLNKFFLPMVKSKQQAGTEMVPFMKAIEDMFKGTKKASRVRVAEFLSERVEGQIEFATDTKWIPKAKEFGLNAGEIEMIQNMQKLTNKLFELGQKEFGWTMHQDYIWNYYGRIRKGQEMEGIMGMGDMWGAKLPKEIDRFWAKYTRSGQLSQFEMDPFVVLRKYVNSFFFEKNVGPIWAAARKFTNMKWQDLTPEIYDKLSRALYSGPQRGQIVGTDYALPKLLRRSMEEFLIYSRGYPMEGERAMYSTIRQVFKRLGMNVNEAAIEEHVNIMQSIWYGAAIGWRPIPIMRNLFQNVFTLYPRIGGRAMQVGYERAVGLEGFERALKAGAFKLKQRGVFYEKILDAPLREHVVQGERGIGKILAPGMRTYLRAGKKMTGLSEASLRQFGHSDVFNRVWAYHAQRAYLEPLVEQFQKGTMTFAKFEKKALKFWGQAERNEFKRLFELDTERAIDYLGARAADIANFIYGHGAQPLAMQGLAGRLFGTFGTWPMWMKDLMFMTWKNGTWAERVQYVARAASVTGTVMAMSYAYGVDMHSWIAYGTPFYWAGGPGVSAIRDFRDVMDSPMERKIPAFMKMVREATRLGYPGQFGIRDFRRGLDQLRKDPNNAWGVVAGWYMGRPLDAEGMYHQGPFMHPRWGAAPVDLDVEMKQNLPIFQMTPYEGREQEQLPEMLRRIGVRR